MTLKYPILNLLSIGKKSFENLGQVIHKSGDTISRLLQPASISFKYTQYLCQSMFRDKRKLFCIIDDTLIKGRQIARTISVLWHDMELEVTIVRHIDKHGDETIVFQVATYKALPHEHAANYKKRWAIEKMIRTSKQHLGLQDCYSKLLQTQHNHVASVLLSYALTQLDMRKYRFKNTRTSY